MFCYISAVFFIYLKCQLGLLIHVYVLFSCIVIKIYIDDKKHHTLMCVKVTYRCSYVQ